MAGVARFDCYPSDLLNGLIGLTADQIAVYVVVLLLQYDRGEAVLLEGRERELAIRAGLSRGRLEKAVDELVDLGKLQRGEGRVWNGRAEEELEKIRARILKNAENSAKGGEVTRQKFREFNNENKGADGPSGQPTGQPSLGSNSPPPPPSKVINLSERRSDPPLPEEEPKPQKRGRYSDDFEAFWSGYPTDQNMSKKAAHTVWARMDVEARRKAMEALPAFRGYCRTNPDYRPVHACRYLSQERFEGHLATAQKINSLTFVRKGTPQWQAWARHRGKEPPSRFDKERGYDGWDFPSEWPPQDQARMPV
jgi:uncharacterized protein YdaU (DUF1376 family)